MKEFNPGDRVLFNRGVGTPNEAGTILKSHKSGKYGYAEIKPASGQKKITKRIDKIKHTIAV